jgi:hypothetical protein
MFAIVTAVVGALLSPFMSRASLVAENLALRQQLAALRREVHRPHLHPADRAFWVLLSRFWSRWTDVLAFVRPATVIAWHRHGFARFTITLDDYVFKGWKPEVDPGVAQAIRDRVLADLRGLDADPVKFNDGLLYLIAALKK